MLQSCGIQYPAIWFHIAYRYTLNTREPLLTKTMPTTAAHYDGSLEYDVHNLYGLAESKATSAALEAILHTRSFALTRCTAP